MPSNLFIPARNSRHRTACFALYRALVREALKIPVSEHLFAGRSIHPVHRLVKKSFKRNRNDVSHRLVFSALAAGYKFLSLLKHAQVPDSKEHASVLVHLTDKLQESARSIANQPAVPIKPDKPIIPLLIRTSAPGEPPTYASQLRPQPASALKGRRRIPVLTATSEGIPFLRFKKPQPVSLSRMIRFKGERRSKKATGLVYLQESLLADARDEDLWEEQLGRLMNDEGTGLGESGYEGSFKDSIHAAIRVVKNELVAERADWVARGRAMWDIVEQETALVKKEKEERTAAWMAKMAKTEQKVDGDNGMDHTGLAKHDPWSKLETAARSR